MQYKLVNELHVTRTFGGPGSAVRAKDYMTHHIKELYMLGVRLHPVLWSWPSRKIMPRISGTRSITPQSLK